MTLPTIQPFDYPDWGQPGVVTATSYNIAAVTISGDVILSLAVGYYNHTLIVFDGNGDGNDYTVLLRWLTASPLEGGSVVWEQFVTVADGTIVVVPATNPTTFLQIVDVGATAYPHNVLVTVTQFAAWGSMVGYPGGTRVLFLLTGVGGADSAVFDVEGCAPGPHELRLDTDSTDFSVYLREWYDWQNPTDFLLLDESATAPYVAEWIAPANAWQLVFANDDAGSVTVNVIITRAPT